MVTLHPTDKVMGVGEKIKKCEGEKGERENQSFDPGVRYVI